MANCLVTKLKEVVVNDQLINIGDIKIHFGAVTTPTVDTHALKVKAENGALTLSVRNGYFTDSTFAQNLGTTHTIAQAATDTVYISNTGADLIIPNKYNQVMAVEYAGTEWFRQNIECNIEDFSYMNILNTLKLRGMNVRGNIEKLYITQPGNFIFDGANTNVSGALDVMFNNAAATRVDFSVSGTVTMNFNNLQKTNVHNLGILASEKITGTLANLASHAYKTPSTFCTSLNLVSSDANGVTGTLADLAGYYGVNPSSADSLICNIAACSNVTGTIESLADALVTAGKVSGKITFMLNATTQKGITVNGSTITKNSYVVTFTGTGVGYTIA